MGRSKPSNSITLLWQAPLALLSLGLFLTLKGAYRALAPKAAPQAPGEAKWLPLGPCSISTAWERLRLHLSRPLWDAHAVVASAGPFLVKKRLRIQIASATSSARTWQILIRDRNGEVRRTLVGADMPPEHYWHEVELPGGLYQVETRYYGGGDEVELPRIDIDGDWFIPRQETPAAIGELYYQALVELEGALSRALHYHVYVAMGRGAFLGWALGLGSGDHSQADSLEAATLPDSPGYERPLENPWTAQDGSKDFAVYRSGRLTRGEALQVEVSPSAFRLYDVYLTLFSAGGRPTAWQRLQEASVMTQPRRGPTSYLIQLHRRGREAAALPESLVSIGHLKGIGGSPIRGVENLP